MKSLRRVARNVVVVVSAGFATVIVATALFAGVLAPHPPDEQNFDLIEAKPGAQAARASPCTSPSRPSASPCSSGGTLGLIAGYAGGDWDNAINRVMDVFFSLDEGNEGFRALAAGELARGLIVF